MSRIPRNTINKNRKGSVQGRLKLAFDKLDPDEAVLLICGHTVLYKDLSDYGYGWCSVCNDRKAKMY